MPDLTVITGNNNTALGDSVMPGATTASFNTGIGALSLNAFVNGNNNTAVGTDSMKLSNGASFNTSIGTGSLKAATVGQGNTAIGFSALAEKTTTNFNTAVGNNCLGNITTGFRNTAVGNDAGKFTADGITSNLTGNQSIFIGDSAKPLANAQNNQIVIGYDAIGNGANTATIGNNSIVKTILKGSVGVGTTLPNYKLEVMGTLGVNRTDGIIFAGSLAAGLGNKITSDTSNNFIFSTSLPSAPYTTIPKMTILNGGNVGIGTTNPSSILHLEDTTPTLKILSNQVYNNSVISMGNGQSEAVSITCNNNPGLSNLELKYDNGGLGDARIRVGQRNLDFMIDGGTAMYINSSKNVGIGTTGPGAYKLAVAGSTVIGGNVEVSDGLGGDQVLTLTPNTGSFKIGDIEGVGDEGYIEGNSSSIKIFTGGGETLVCDVNQRVGIGIAIPQSKLQVNGGVQLANDTASPSATKVGTFRYRTSGNNSYVDMCMQTGASTYAWVNIVTNSW